MLTGRLLETMIVEILALARARLERQSRCVIILKARRGVLEAAAEVPTLCFSIGQASEDICLLLEGILSKCKILYC